MALTARDLNRATLARQLLLRRAALPVEEAVHRVVALQAQHPASPYLALWNRVTGFDPAGVAAGFADGRLVKATLMRITLHAVHVDDYATFHQAMQPTLRAARLGDPRFTAGGLSAGDADAVVPALLEFARRPRTGAEAEAWLAERLGVPAAGLWWALRQYAPLRQVPTGGPWSFGARPAFTAAGDVVRPSDSGPCDAALQELALRYLSGFGPASAADLAQFALVQRSRARDALRGLADRVEVVAGPDGELADLPGAPRPAGDVPAPPRLLPMWDSVLLAYADRSRVIPPAYRKLVTRSNGDVLPTLLVDGHVAGVWRPTDAGIEATAFAPLTSDVWTALEHEASELRRLLADRDPTVYGRYARWWATLPQREVRILGRA